MLNIEGQFIWVRLNFTRTKSFSRENPCFVYTVRDIHEDMLRLLKQESIATAVKEQNETLESANQALTKFFSNLSHEIRTPINGILGINEIILRESGDENILSYAKDIKGAGKFLLNLVNDILDYSKIEAGKMEIIPVEYELKHVVTELVNMIEKRVADKGLETLVKAFVRLNGSYPQTTLTIVGEEEQGIDPLPEETLHTLYNNKAIMPVGKQSNVDCWLRKADCLILPSRREGFPNVLLEASATGIPSISTDVNGAREILKSEQGDGGIIVPVDDVESLREAMEKIVTDTVLGTALGNNACRIAAERFNEITVYQNLMDFYNQKL